jgi:catechol 2,3-dioxygenase-like lactoylglutathione lyase family enzyme
VAGVAQRLSLVTLGVGDVSKARQFYARLGWVESSASNEHVAFFQAGSMAIALFGRDALAEDAQVEAVGEGFSGVTLAINAHSREETDRFFEAFLAAGGTAVKVPAPVFWGGYSGYARDPDGHLFEFAHNPFWPMDASGAIILPV